METLLTPQAWLSAGLIFMLRLSDMSLDTLRVLFVMRGQKAIAWLLGFFQAAIFITAISTLLRDLNNPLNIVGYAAGFATGNVLGMAVEDWLAVGFTHIRIISSRRGAAIAESLRNEGFGVTEIPARGKDGVVTVLNCSVKRKNVEKIRRMVNDVDEDAFVTREDIRPVRRGFWRA